MFMLCYAVKPGNRRDTPHLYEYKQRRQTSHLYANAGGGCGGGGRGEE